MHPFHPDPRFNRHILACDSANLPADRVKLFLSGQHIGWVAPKMMIACGETQTEQGFSLADNDALAKLIGAMRERNFFRVRTELFDVRASYDAPPLAQIDRGLMPVFGLLSQGVHLNGLVQKVTGLHVWVGKRAENKLIAPGKLDHLIAGGVPSGHDPAETLVKEGAEEAGLPPELAKQAVKVATIDYAMRRPEGVSRDRIHCYDLYLPEEFTPYPVDGEMQGFELWPIEYALARVRDTDDFKYNVNLVLIDLFIRKGLIPSFE